MHHGDAGEVRFAVAAQQVREFHQFSVIDETPGEIGVTSRRV